MRRVVWARPFDWCHHHDVPWKAHVEYDLPLTPWCDTSEIWVEDTEYAQKVGEPDTQPVSKEGG
jgi:hypothetical protein